jgi:hypothetical protein
MSRFESYPLPIGHGSVAHLITPENVASGNGVADE